MNERPTDKDLIKIASWHGNYDELLDFVDSVFVHDYGRFEQKDGLWEIATGGWSGNEEIVSALKSNRMFWTLYWKSSHRGGLFVFESMLKK